MNEKNLNEIATSETLQLQIDGLENKIKEVAKQYISIQRTLDAIYEDRDLLTDILASIHKVRELVFSADRHTEKMIESTKTMVEMKSDEVKTEVNEKADEVKTQNEEVKQSIAQKVIKGVSKTFQKEDIIFKKKSLWNHLTNLFSFDKLK